MNLTFHGTRGYVDASSPTHQGHSAFTIEEDGFRLLCDFGENRKGTLSSIRPDGIVVSHAHPDHAWGLEEATDAPVYASAESAQAGALRAAGVPVQVVDEDPEILIRALSDTPTVVWLAYELTELSLRNRIVTHIAHVSPGQTANYRNDLAGPARACRCGTRFGAPLRCGHGR